LSASKKVQDCTGEGAMRAGFDQNAFVAYLRLTHRRDVTWNIWKKTGIPEATAKNWLLHRCGPSLPHFLALARAYGLSLVEACWSDPPDVIVAAAQAERLAALEAQISALEAERERMRGTS
jgi:hypothetical protein